MLLFDAADPQIEIPEPRWERPAMLIPGRKPVGPVTIDRSKAPGLVVYTLFRDLTNHSCENIADPTNRGVYSGAAFTVDPVRITPQGMGIEFHPLSTTGASSVLFDNRKKLGNNFSMFGLYKSQTNAVSYQYISATNFGKGATDCYRHYFSSSTAYSVSYIDTSPAQFNTTVTLPSEVGIGTLISYCSRKYGNTIEVWVSIDNGPILKSTPTTAGNGNLRNRDINDFYVSGSDVGDSHAIFYVTGIDDYAVSDAEMEQRILDPYQFLIPA